MTDNPTPNDIALLREALLMAQRGSDNVFHELNRDPNWQPTRADYTSLGYLLQNIASTIGRRPATALAPGQHDGAAGEEFDPAAKTGLVQITPAIDQALRDALFAASKQVAGPIMLEPSTEQARAEGPSDSDMLQARFNEIMAEIETTGRCVLRRNDLGDLLAAASALAATPSGADALGYRL